MCHSVDLIYYITNTGQYNSSKQEINTFNQINNGWERHHHITKLWLLSQSRLDKENEEDMVLQGLLADAMCKVRGEHKDILEETSVWSLDKKVQAVQ